MSRISTLFRLQTIDVELDGHRIRLTAIEQSLSDSPAVRAAQARVVEHEARLQAARVQLRSLEMDNQAVSEKIAETDQVLYGGAVTNPKELRDLQQEQAALGRRRAAVEEHQLDVMLQAETAETQWVAAQTALEQAETEAAQTQGHLLEERRRLQARVAQLEGEREAVNAAVSPEDGQLYQRLRLTKNRRPVAPLDEEGCTACGEAPSASRIQDARRGTDIVRCSNCERILYAE